ncbi:MAG: cell division ATP-binding protein FtsE [Alphaproteobacteria bacterium]|nr:cell division ATP-binding protein FtsE [Alphaproteobacteria bacterium]
MIFFENVSMRYGLEPEILHDINFQLNPGSFHFLIGPSGAGKSSLLRLMYLALRPAAGTIRIFGRDVQTLRHQDFALLRRRIGVIFQDFRLLDHLTAFENVALPLRVAGIPKKLVHEYVTELLIWVGLSNHLHAFPHTLSGGQQQRVAIARAVIGRPSLLLADEPTGNVDDSIGVKLMYLFDELNKMGTTVVIATHNENLVGRFTHPQIRIESNMIKMLKGK